MDEDQVKARKKYFASLHHHVHSALRLLKMGERSTISCTKEFPMPELMMYVQAYALHKGKWFDLHLEHTSNVIHATRAKPPPWDPVPEEYEYEEP